MIGHYIYKGVKSNFFQQLGTSVPENYIYLFIFANIAGPDVIFILGFTVCPSTPLGSFSIKRVKIISNRTFSFVFIVNMYAYQVITILQLLALTQKEECYRL